jgi:uncharacterized membrane protein HdeD (DUF308 family)
MELLIIIGVWIAFGAWGASVCKDRGREEGLGWCLGLFFGILGVIICYMLSATPVAQVCQKCGHRRAGAYCSNCGAPAVSYHQG